jgi:GST-like protein
MAAPIELYYWPTPNGWKITVALEEMGLPYNLHLVNIGAGEQFAPEFLKISPNNRMPAIIDPNGPDGAPISIFGQAHHFLKYAPAMDPPQDLPYAKDRYRSEAARLYGVLDRQLAQHEFVAGDFLSIADFAIWPWASLWEGQQQTLDDKPHLKRWLDQMGARPGVQAGRAVAAEKRGDIAKDRQAQEALFKRG